MPTPLSGVTPTLLGNPVLGDGAATTAGFFVGDAGQAAGRRDGRRRRRGAGGARGDGRSRAGAGDPPDRALHLRAGSSS
jgi:hypothetical protein